jgi:hypothetical protein
MHAATTATTEAVARGREHGHERGGDHGLIRLEEVLGKETVRGEALGRRAFALGCWYGHEGAVRE